MIRPVAQVVLAALATLLVLGAVTAVASPPEAVPAPSPPEASAVQTAEPAEGTSPVEPQCLQGTEEELSAELLAPPIEEAAGGPCCTAACEAVCGVGQACACIGNGKNCQVVGCEL